MFRDQKEFCITKDTDHIQKQQVQL